MSEEIAEVIAEVFSRKLEDFSDRESYVFEFTQKYCPSSDLGRRLDILDEAYEQGFRLYRDIIKTIRDVKSSRDSLGKKYTYLINELNRIRNSSMKRLGVLEEQIYRDKWKVQQNKIQGGN